MCSQSTIFLSPSASEVVDEEFVGAAALARLVAHTFQATWELLGLEVDSGEQQSRVEL